VKNVVGIVCPFLSDQSLLHAFCVSETAGTIAIHKHTVCLLASAVMIRGNGDQSSEKARNTEIGQGL
jgi:hypothetical protein